MFGGSWAEENKAIGPMSHWLEDDFEEDDSPMVPGFWKDLKRERKEDKRIGPMSSWAEENLK